MKRHLALFTVAVLAACGSLYGQDGDPNAELEAWRAALADYNRRADEVQQQYNEAMALWQANFEEATRPMSPGERFLAGLQYVGDKALTGVVNYYSNRAAIRSEGLGGFEARFNGLRNDVMGARADILAANNTSTTSIMGAIETSSASILGANQTSTATIMGALNTSGEVLGQLGTNLNTAIMGNRAAITANGTGLATNEQLLRDVLSNLQQSCDTPFGAIGEPCRP